MLTEIAAVVITALTLLVTTLYVAEVAAPGVGASRA